MPTNCLRRWPNTTLTVGHAVYVAAAPKQTRAIHPILFQCWPNVFDAGPKLKQYRVIVPCLLEYCRIALLSSEKPLPDNTDELAHC